MVCEKILDSACFTLFSSLLDGLLGGEQEWIVQKHPTGFILLNAPIVQ